MKNLNLLCLLVLASCATPLTTKERSFVYVEKTNLSAENAYNMTLSFLAKTLVNSNRGIQLKDANKKRIISQIGISCNEVKNGFLDVASYTTYFTLQVDFKSKKVRLSISGDSYSSRNIDGSLIHVNKAFESHRREGLIKCASKLKDQVIAALKVKENKNW